MVPLAYRIRRPRPPPSDLHRFLLETDADESVHLAGKPGLRQSSPPLVSVPGGRVAQGPAAHLGPVRVGRTIADRTGAAWCGVPAELDSLPPTPRQRLDPAGLPPLVLRPYPLHGRALLLSAVQRPETEQRRFPAGRHRLRPDRMDGIHRVAP